MAALHLNRQADDEFVAVEHPRIREAVHLTLSALIIQHSKERRLTGPPTTEEILTVWLFYPRVGGNVLKQMNGLCNLIPFVVGILLPQNRISLHLQRHRFWFTHSPIHVWSLCPMDHFL